MMKVSYTVYKGFEVIRVNHRGGSYSIYSDGVFVAEGFANKTLVMAFIDSL